MGTYPVYIFAALMAVSEALAQGYPVKPIRLVSSHPVGANGDVAGRLMAPKMGEKLGQPLVFESRTGANGAIAANVVATSAPDGHTLLYVGAGTMVTNQFLVKNLPFDSLRDFTPISQASKATTFLVVTASVPASTVKELIEYAKRNPGKLSFGSTGIGSPFHLMGETFKSAAGVDIVHVPYSGGNSALAQNDLITGRLDVYFPSYTAIRQHIGGGKVRLLAAMDTQRYKRLPDVPPLTEAVPAFRPVPSWNGFMGPANLPAAIVYRLHETIVSVLAEPDFVARMDDLGIIIIGNTPEAFARAMRTELETFGEVVKSLGIQPQ
jgi:tripartite-type tricarboxylate transporter receptor subunit TctC